MEKVLLIVRITRPVAQKGLHLTTPAIKRLEELVSYGYVCIYVLLFCKCFLSHSYSLYFNIVMVFHKAFLVLGLVGDG